MSRAKVPIIAIVGRANVGKSSFFNAVIKKREAITSNEPGTTRDKLIARASYGGKDFWLVDTAGVKDPEDDFEATIQQQIIEASESADMIILMIDAAAAINDEDRRLSKSMLKTKKPVILIANKIDQVKTPEVSQYGKLGIKDIFLTSVSQSRGISEVLAHISANIPKASIKDDKNRLRLTILGRPNAGKSALFNALGKKQQAIVASRAGTTRDVNRANIRYEKKDIEIMDTAGIRRSGKIKQGVERFSVIRSLAAIEESDVCLLLMDVNELNVQLDQKIAGMVKEAGKGLILVVSKWDVAEGRDAFTRDLLAPQIARNFAFVPWAPLVFTSSVTGQNVTRIFELLLEIDKNRRNFIKTTQLNKWLQSITAKHPPAGLKNRAPKLHYIVQEEDNPAPNFKVYGSDTKFLHWSYKRFMEKELRSNFGFAGTPIKFWFFDRK
ncbi:MAG TPA: ribosome biogenesis GTPase Der [Candidatus Saccharimonadales bacterium]|nr:ribosome biogenesis GTPase Der [Candidatus Saccharimonadales bacterium]